MNEELALFRLDDEEYETLIPFLSYAESAHRLQCCSKPILPKDIVTIHRILTKHGWNLSASFACNQCVITLLSTLYRVLTHPSNDRSEIKPVEAQTEAEIINPTSDTPKRSQKPNKQAKNQNHKSTSHDSKQ